MGRKIMKNDKKNRRNKNSITQDYENSQIDDKNDNNSKDYDTKLEKIMIKRRVKKIRRRVITIQQTIITRR